MSTIGMVSRIAASFPVGGGLQNAVYGLPYAAEHLDR
jgi:hypothetical protein